MTNKEKDTYIEWNRADGRTLERATRDRQILADHHLRDQDTAKEIAHERGLELITVNEDDA